MATTLSFVNSLIERIYPLDARHRFFAHSLLRTTQRYGAAKLCYRYRMGINESTSATQRGRDDLVTWRAAKSSNFFRSVPALAKVLQLRMGERYTSTLHESLDAFGHEVVNVIEPAVVITERSREFPKLRPYDELGSHLDAIEFHPAHDVAARCAWASGMTSTPLTRDGAFELASLFFLLSHVGEGGQACPIVCTIGLRRALERYGSAELRSHFLDGLTSTDSSTALRGSQFLTELQGGSDVGANATFATPDPELAGAWRLSGEKWFCSVANADLFALTARCEGAGVGTKGLSCFVVPRTIDGRTPNGFRIRRLKDKLGTRGLASGEIDFVDALAWPIGELAEGFAIAVDELLNTSRWLNALGSTGIMSRAYLEASSFAHHRRAFGQPIIAFDAVREQLAIMKIETHAALASSFALTDLVGLRDDASATSTQNALHRFLVNANKYVTSIVASDVVHRAIEVLGGNGTIEDFSALPRLYRDAIVFESWEGTHNVLCAQVRRDCARLGLLDVVYQWVESELALVSSTFAHEVEHTQSYLQRLQPALTHSVENPDEPEGTFRRQLTLITRVLQGVCLLRSASHGESSDVDAAIASAFIELHLVDQDPTTHPTWLAYVDRLLQ